MCLSQNTRISIVLVERFDRYMKQGIKIESLYCIGFVISSRTRGCFINLYQDPDTGVVDESLLALAYKSISLNLGSIDVHG